MIVTSKRYNRFRYAPWCFRDCFQASLRPISFRLSRGSIVLASNHLCVRASDGSISLRSEVHGRRFPRQSDLAGVTVACGELPGSGGPQHLVSLWLMVMGKKL